MTTNSVSEDIKTVTIATIKTTDLENLNYGVEITNNKLDDIQSTIIKNKTIGGAHAQNVKLSDPPTGHYNRGSVVKKYYLGVIPG
ncbi:5926_t:CDS:2 [Cetraspora pellucida]|uniref:5926_t:CDS:1 n=1 Tax=Cetraspora pellucida TaxID=1433469 RepID=A0A9N9EQF5_9GLOM|nr:5926_t:CDS:2 [Cetraspora pellucida]